MTNYSTYFEAQLAAPLNVEVYSAGEYTRSFRVHTLDEALAGVQGDLLEVIVDEPTIKILTN